jgi:hypothetical protein
VEAEVEDIGAAATTVDNLVAVTLTGMLDDTEIRVYTAGDPADELAGIEAATAGTTDDRSFTFSLTAALDVDINILHKDRALNTYFSITIPASLTSIPVFQQTDRVYINP